jgi:hypothetical protein
MGENTTFSLGAQTLDLVSSRVPGGVLTPCAALRGTTGGEGTTEGGEEEREVPKGSPFPSILFVFTPLLQILPLYIWGRGGVEFMPWKVWD